jgi:phosphohistidine phosphatase
MNLYLIRHGDAEADKSDAERGLTKSGAEAVQRTAALVTTKVGSPAIVLSSPLKRALETADFFARGWGVKIEQVDWLQAGVEPSVVIGELKKRAEQNIALVGHLPNLGLLMGTLVFGLPPKEVVLPKSGVACLSLASLEPGAAKLRWLMAPEMI